MGWRTTSQTRSFLAPCKSSPSSSNHHAENLVRIISVPFPTHRLALAALRALQVDVELSSLVRRSFSLTAPSVGIEESTQAKRINGSHSSLGKSVQVSCDGERADELKTVLRIEYKATTNRMLRVAVNGFMESLGVVLSVMEELDVDVLMNEA